MSPNEREWGALETKLEQVIHTQRNMKMIIDLLSNECKSLEADVARIKIMMRTTISVVAVILALFAWIVEMIVR